MKIALICPSNMLYMPYVKNYEQILIEEKINYEIINWDRFQMEEFSKYKYRDKKIGHQRNYFDYRKYQKFLLNIINFNIYDKIVVFGIQLVYFLKDVLLEHKDKYILDIRDYNKIFNLFNIDKIIEHSRFTVLSSPGYKKWLPISDKYVINHNIELDKINNNYKPYQIRKEESEKINISFIGALRDMKINKNFIKSIKNNDRFHIYFHGEGDINKKLVEYTKANYISNVYITGRYENKNEEKLYEKSNLINVLRYNDGINNKTALPNRLYNAVLYGKPLLAFNGNYLADQISSNNIGIVINNFDHLEEKINNYIESFDADQYSKGREHFFSKVIDDNLKFKENLLEFINN